MKQWTSKWGQVTSFKVSLLDVNIQDSQSGVTAASQINAARSL